MSETHADQIERVARMVEGDRIIDLDFSDDGYFALSTVLNERRELLEALKLAEEAMTNAYDVEYRADPKSYAGIALLTARALIARCEGTAKAAPELLMAAPDLLDACRIAAVNAKHNRLNQANPNGGCWTTCAACVIEKAIAKAEAPSK